MYLRVCVLENYQNPSRNYIRSEFMNKAVTTAEFAKAVQMYAGCDFLERGFIEKKEIGTVKSHEPRARTKKESDIGD
jgi:hypothetical protein